jgi:DNA-binding PucR family transcriptional regulator
VAIGARREGVMGFRGTHADAVAVQRLVGSRAEVACFEDEELALLGDLAGAEDTLRATVADLPQRGGQHGATARALHTHRNTVVQRLKRARQLLPVSLGRGVRAGDPDDGPAVPVGGGAPS